MGIRGQAPVTPLQHSHTSAPAQQFIASHSGHRINYNPESAPRRLPLLPPGHQHSSQADRPPMPLPHPAHSFGSTSGLVNQAHRQAAPMPVFAHTETTMQDISPPVPERADKPACDTAPSLPPKARQQLKLNINAAAAEKTKDMDAREAFSLLKIATDDQQDSCGIHYRSHHTERHQSVKSAENTMIKTADGFLVAANRLQVDGRNVAIRTQYPTSAGLGNHMKMLAENRTPVLVVLASDDDIRSGGGSFPEYFRQDGHDKASGMSWQCQEWPNEAKRKQTIGNDLNIHRYVLTIRGAADGKTITIPVIHATNWTDHKTTGPDNVEALAKMVNTESATRQAGYVKMKSSATRDPGKLLPVIHCRAGIGRTGELVTAMQLVKPENKLSAEQIVLELRKTGSDRMVQTHEQYNTLLQLEKKY